MPRRFGAGHSILGGTQHFSFLYMAKVPPAKKVGAGVGKSKPRGTPNGIKAQEAQIKAPDLEEPHLQFSGTGRKGLVGTRPLPRLPLHVSRPSVLKCCHTEL